MPIPAEKLTQLTAAYNYTAVLCLVTGDLSTYTITADAGTNTITATGHDFVNGTPIQFTNSGGALPSGIAADTTYFVIGAATNTFQISSAIAGSAVDITSTGSGTNTVTEVAIADEINQYTDAELAWDVMVRHEVASYQGAGRVSFSWGAPTQNTTNGEITTPEKVVAIVPSTGSITYKYAVLLRGGNTTLGSSVGAIADIQERDEVITLQGQEFGFRRTMP